MKIWSKTYIWAQMPKYGNLGPDPPKMKIFKKLFFHVKGLVITLPTSSQQLSDDNFSWRSEAKRVFGPKCPNMVIWSQTPKKWIFSKNYFFMWSAWQLRFQRALSHYQMIIFHQDITEKPPLALKRTVY